LGWSGGESGNKVLAQTIHHIQAFLIIVDFTAKEIRAASFIEAKLSSVGTVVAIQTTAALIHGCTRTGAKATAVYCSALEVSIHASAIRTFHFTVLKKRGVT
jgi:hypothetical protein